MICFVDKGGNLVARIRTVKPEFFRHELLQDLGTEYPHLHPMLVFIGIWTISDREGRFIWKPRSLKLDILPFLEFSMEAALDLLCENGFIEKYEHGGATYGAVVSWDRHQIVSRDESPSEIPAPDGTSTPYFRPLNQTQRLKVYERDNWTCAYCGRDMKNDRRAACLDHVYPYSKGGTNREQNLVTSCKKCNSIKSDKTPTEAGFDWPDGIGEYLDKSTNMVCQHGVNHTLTGGAEVPDKEREGEREGEKEEERKGEDDVPAKPSRPAKKKKLTDDEFMQALRDNPIYAGLDIDRLKGKMEVWCAGKGLTPSRARLVNWLNKEDKPLAPSVAEQTYEKPEWQRGMR